VLGTEGDYVKIFEIFRDQVWFGGDPNPGDSFQVYPGMEVRPNFGPEGVTAILDRGEAARLNLAITEPELGPDVENYNYMGRNLSILNRYLHLLGFDDIPCFIWGLDPDDLIGIKAWSAIRELEDLLSFYDKLGMEELDSEWVALNSSREHYAAGDYREAHDSALATLDEAYSSVMNQAWPLVEAGFADPRNSPVPMVIVNRIYNSKRHFDEGDQEHGRIYLMNAIKEWSEVDEVSSLSAIVLVLGPLFLRRYHSTTS
jgi:hypothetical protein